MTDVAMQVLQTVVVTRIPVSYPIPFAAQVQARIHEGSRCKVFGTMSPAKQAPTSS
jgi:hypothetical protein